MYVAVLLTLLDSFWSCERIRIYPGVFFRPTS